VPTHGCTALLVVLSTAAMSDRAAPEVEVVDCPDLSSDRIRALLSIEHPDVSETRDLGVVVRCSDEAVIIEVEDALTRKTVQRSIDAPPVGHPEREREVVLAVSSLIVASWMELFVPREQVHPPLPAPSADTTAAKRVVERAVQTRPRAALQFLTSVRWRVLPEALAVLHTGLRIGGFVHRSWEVFGQAAFEYGRAERTRGQIDGYAALFGPGVAWTLRPDKDFGLEIWGTLSGGYVRLAGRPSMADIDAGAVGGTTCEVELGLGPRFRASSFVMVLDVRGGYTIENPKGVVTDETAVTFGGFWVGVGLRVGGLLGRRMD
jgi:hypothetical protein